MAKKAKSDDISVSQVLDGVPSLSMTTDEIDALEKKLDKLLTVPTDIVLWDDRSGSFRKLSRFTDAGWQGFVREAAKDGRYDEWLRLKHTKMSSYVKTTGFHPPSKLPPLIMIDGGDSPQEQLISDELATDRRTLVAYMGDGIAKLPFDNKAIQSAINRLLRLQEKYPIDVYPVELGRNVDTKFTRAISLRKEPLVIEDVLDNPEVGEQRIAEFFRGLLTTVQEIAAGTVNLDDVKSLSLEKIRALEQE